MSSSVSVRCFETYSFFLADKSCCCFLSPFFSPFVLVWLTCALPTSFSSSVERSLGILQMRYHCLYTTCSYTHRWITKVCACVDTWLHHADNPPDQVMHELCPSTRRCRFHLHNIYNYTGILHDTYLGTGTTVTMGRARIGTVTMGRLLSRWEEDRDRDLSEWCF